LLILQRNLKYQQLASDDKEGGKALGAVPDTFIRAVKNAYRLLGE